MQWKCSAKCKAYYSPGSHGSYIGEIVVNKEKSKVPELTVTILEEFLDEPFEDKKSSTN